jgi:hypothetical protein
MISSSAFSIYETRSIYISQPSNTTGTIARKATPGLWIFHSSRNNTAIIPAVSTTPRTRAW